MEFVPYDLSGVSPSARQSQAVRIRNLIWEQIVSVTIAPGAALIEADLAREFGVSKTPVREALQTLAALGIVRVLPHKGYVVRSLELTDVREVMDFRMILEPALAGLAAKNTNDILVTELRRLVAEQFRTDASLDDRLDAAHSFHLTLVRGSGNRRAAATIEHLSFEIARLHRVFPVMREHISSTAERESHTAIVEAIALGNVAEASSQMRAHLVESNETMVRAFYDSAGNLHGAL